ncbi:hypothetical protein M426DRAFT_23109 [Hypoxylon sp. CI-4A]|nr:hypothetical protein M426DRAFT_23109 [Hypoxylon sp. CI-4A]
MGKLKCHAETDTTTITIIAITTTGTVPPHPPPLENVCGCVFVNGRCINCGDPEFPNGGNNAHYNRQQEELYRQQTERYQQELHELQLAQIQLYQEQQQERERQQEQRQEQRQLEQFHLQQQQRFYHIDLPPTLSRRDYGRVFMDWQEQWQNGRTQGYPLNEHHMRQCFGEDWDRATPHEYYDAMQNAVVMVNSRQEHDSVSRSQNAPRGGQSGESDDLDRAIRESMRGM